MRKAERIDPAIIPYQKRNKAKTVSAIDRTSSCVSSRVSNAFCLSKYREQEKGRLASSLTLKGGGRQGSEGRNSKEHILTDFTEDVFILPAIDGPCRAMQDAVLDN